MAKKLFIKLQTPTIEMEVTAKDASGKEDKILVGFKRYTVEQLQAKFKEAENQQLDETSDFKFMSEEVVYLKNVVLEIYDENDKYLEDLVVADTRTVTQNEFFQDSKDALDVLLKHYINSNPWKNSLFEAYRKALLNMSYEDAEAKNL